MPKRRSPGEGSVYRRADGLYAAALSWIDNKGTRRRKVLYAKTKRAVLEKLREAQAEQRANVPTPPPEQTFGEFLLHWFEHTVKPNIKATTYLNRSVWVHKHIIPALGDVPLQSLTAEDVERFQAAKLKEGKAPATVKQFRITIISCLEAAVRRGYIPRNVGRLAGGIRVPHSEMHCLDQEQARTLLEAAQGDRFYALYLLALTLGLRKGELLALRWQDVDLERATVQVSGSLQRIGGKQLRVDTKTANANRTLRLTPQLVEALNERREMQRMEYLMSEDKWRDTGYIFTTRHGSPINSGHTLLYFGAILKKAGLPHIRFHDLRHTAATLMLANGVQIYHVSRILGHANIQTTLSKYAHLLKAVEEQVVEILAKMYA